MKKHLTLILLLAGFAASAQKINLALNLKKDSTYYLKNESTITVAQNIQGQQIDIKTGIKGSISHKVVAITDSIYTMEVRYVSMSMNINAMGNDINFSSDDKGEAATGPMAQVTDMVGKLLRGIINKPFTIELSKTGRVVSVKNIDALFTGMFAGLPSTIPDEQRAQFKAQLEKSFGETSIKNSFQQAFPAFPTHKIGINDQWTGSNSIESTISLKINTTYTLKEVTGNAYVVHGEGAITDGGVPKQQQINGMTATFDKMSGNLSADYSFDKTTGWVISSKTNNSIDATVSMDPPGGGGTISYPMKLTIVSAVQQ